MGRKNMRSQWVFSLLVNGMPDEKGSGVGGLGRYRRERLRQMVLHSVFPDYNGERQVMRDGYRHV